MAIPALPVFTAMSTAFTLHILHFELFAVKTDVVKTQNSKPQHLLVKNENVKIQQKSQMASNSTQSYLGSRNRRNTGKYYLNCHT